MANKKIGILTLQFSNNYGGFLQTYALYSALLNLGYIPIILDRRIYDKCNFFKKAYFKVANYYIYRNFYRFREMYFKNITKPIYNDTLLTHESSDFFAIIVGSDQVWRLKFTKEIGFGYNFFLDFVKNKNIRKISYAASFGTNKFDASESELDKIRILLETFSAISVREASGSVICRDYFNREALHVVDPTLLHPAKFYESIIDQSEIVNINKTDFNVRYFLDFSESKIRLINIFCQISNFELVNIYRSSNFDFSLKRDIIPNKCHIFPSFSNWLWNIKNAHFILTDSFHGVVFCLIFNKEFVCIANKSRGTDRLISLFEMVGIENRFFDENDEIDFSILFNNKIDYNIVNNNIEFYKNKSYEFLKKSLI